MAGDSQNGEEILKRPLYVFDLPPELLSTLTSKNAGQQTPLVSKEDDETPQTPEDVEKENGIATVTSCSLCQVSFQNVQEQREHTRSDHHRYNLKSRFRGNKPLNEAEFNKAIGELDESISGSESESEDEQEEGQKSTDNTLTALLRKQAKISATEPEEALTKKKGGVGKHPLLWFSSSLFSPTTSLGVYRSLFTNVEQEEPDHLVESLRNKQVKPFSRPTNAATQPDRSADTSQQPSSHIFMCMIGGGHFAAMIVALAPETHKKAGGFEERQARVLAHKTFHRYTTRRKQGGSQSANDSSKGAAHSAGSSLRRYNEAALESEIRQLLGEWKGMIDTAQLLFVRATGSTNRRILFGPYDGQALKQSDPRLRGFPFSTRRATQGELMRAFTELTRLKVSHIDEAALAAQDEKQREVAPKPPKPSSQPQKPKLSKEEEVEILHTSQIQALIRRSKVPALLSYISNNSIPPSFTFHQSASQQHHRSPTPLHLAASSNSSAIVLALLTKAKMDPTSPNGEGQPAFDLAGDRATRDAFRVARHELGENTYDWDAAHVPPGISKSDADSRAERDKKVAEEEETTRRKAEMERLKREDAERKTQEDKRKPGGRTLASTQKTGAEKREEETRGMTPEMRMRLERERRARAAEERMRRMQRGAS